MKFENWVSLHEYLMSLIRQDSSPLLPPPDSSMNTLVDLPSNKTVPVQVIGSTFDSSTWVQVF